LIAEIKRVADAYGGRQNAVEVSFINDDTSRVESGPWWRIVVTRQPLSKRRTRTMDRVAGGGVTLAEAVEQVIAHKPHADKIEGRR